MFKTWKRRHINGLAPLRGYSRRQVDAFLTHIGSEHAHGVDGRVLAVAIREVSFPMAARGYDPATIDAHLDKLHAQFDSTSAAIAA